jgi:hypothetical protein
MAMLERLRQFFSLTDPTGDWQRDPMLRLEVDLARPSLNGVELGRPLFDLSGLGKVEDRHGAEFGYPSLGLVIESVDDETFTDFHLVHADPFRPTHAPFAGELRCGQRRLALADMTEARWTELLGECYWRDADDEEVLLFFEFPYHELQVELTLDGAMKCLVVAGKPLMADEEQRRAYGVTRPWPPERFAGQ